MPFQEMDFHALTSKALPSPWKPPISDPLDTSNFDPYDDETDVARYTETADRWHDEF
jgi:hypothetical protein